MEMNMVSTKPVRHHFGKVSTEEAGQGSSGLGRGGGRGEGPPSVAQLFRLVDRWRQV